MLAPDSSGGKKQNHRFVGLVWPPLQIGTVQIVLEVVNRIVRGPLVLGALGAACV